MVMFLKIRSFLNAKIFLRQFRPYHFAPLPLFSPRGRHHWEHLERSSQRAIHGEGVFMVYDHEPEKEWKGLNDDLNYS